MARRYLALLLAPIVLAAACQSDGADRPAATRIDSAGIELVHNAGTDRPLEITTSTDFGLGGQGAGPESFYRLYPRYVAVGPDGSIAVLNRPAFEVSVFDARGAHVMTLGQEGDGPGEFDFPSSVVVRPDGVVDVYDYGKRALVRFAPDGAVLEQAALTVPFGGTEMVAGSDALLLISQNAPRRDGVLTRRLLRLSPVDTVLLGPAAESSVSTIFYEACGVRITLPPLFASDLVWASNGRRTAVVASAEYSIRVFDGKDLVRIIRREAEPETVTESVVRRELGEGEPWSVGGRSCVVPVDEVIEKRGYADRIPVIEAMALEPSGTLWVKRRPLGSSGASIDVFDESGEYVGSADADITPFPLRFLPDGRMLTIERDSMDVDRVVAYQVAR